MELLGKIKEKISKKTLYLITSLLLGTALYAISPSLPNPRVLILAATVLGSLAWGASWWLFRDLTKTVLPTGLFFGGLLILTFFPHFSHLFRLLFVMIWAGSFDSCLLSENVFLVAQERGVAIPLVRPAQTFSLLLTLLTTFLLLTGVYKAPLNFFLQALLCFLVVFFLAWQNLVGQWLTFEPGFIGGQTVRRKAAMAALGAGLVVAELALGLSFWPQKSFFRALALTTAFYVVLGTYLHLVNHTLNRRILGEYLSVAAAAYLLVSIVD